MLTHYYPLYSLYSSSTCWLLLKRCDDNSNQHSSPVQSALNCFVLFPHEKQDNTSSAWLSFSVEDSSACLDSSWAGCAWTGDQKAGRSLLMVKSFTAVLTTGGDQRSADFYLPVSGSAGTLGGAATEALWLTVVAEGSLPLQQLITAERRGRMAVWGPSRASATRGEEGWWELFVWMPDSLGEMSCLDTEGHLIVPPWGVSCPLLCASLMKGAQLWPVAMCSSIFPWRVGLDVTLWQKMSTKLIQRLQVYNRRAVAHSSIHRSNCRVQTLWEICSDCRLKC